MMHVYACAAGAVLRVVADDVYCYLDRNPRDGESRISSQLGAGFQARAELIASFTSTPERASQLTRACFHRLLGFSLSSLTSRSRLAIVTESLSEAACARDRPVIPLESCIWANVRHLQAVSQQHALNHRTQALQLHCKELHVVELWSWATVAIMRAGPYSVGRGLLDLFVAATSLQVRHIVTAYPGG